MTERPVPRGMSAPDAIALALAAAMREIAARETAERAERRATMTIVQGGKREVAA